MFLLLLLVRHGTNLFYTINYFWTVDTFSAVLCSSYLHFLFIYLTRFQYGSVVFLHGMRDLHRIYINKAIPGMHCRGWPSPNIVSEELQVTLVVCASDNCWFQWSIPQNKSCFIKITNLVFITLLADHML
jgi:hypothetical protein